MPGDASHRRRLAGAAGPALLAVLLALPCGPRAAAGQPAVTIRAGVIVPAVATRAQPDQNYAIYLPSSYDPARKWPVLYAFDPGARGERPLECFRAAAEKLGYVLVGSNVSRNGAFAPSVQAGVTMIRDTLERFAVDERRLYVTGFSGGARVASALALHQKGIIAAVVACGGGFPTGVTPGAQTPFALCGTAGDDDFNRLELHRLDRAMASAGKSHRLIRFPGGHTWPPPDAAMAGVEWLELEAMRAGTRPKDAALAGSWLQRDLERVKSEESRGALYDAWLGYSDLATAYRGVVDVQALEARAAALYGQDAVKKEIKRERDREERELLQQAEIARDISQFSDSEGLLDATRNLHSLVKRLEREERNGRTPAERHMARRLLEFASITAYYAGEPLLESGEFRAALACFELQAAIHPESASAHYRVAMTHARAGNRSKALEALKTAAERGFADATRIEQEPGFEPVRKAPEYQQILEAVRKNARM